MHVVCAEADDDFGDAEEEGLGPEFEEFAVEFESVGGGGEFGGGFELDPGWARGGVGGGVGGLGVPYCGLSLVWCSFRLCRWQAKEQ